MKSAQFQLHAAVDDRHWWFLARRQIVRRLVEQVVPPSPDSTIIDVGCGTGGDVALLANDYRSIGIDVSAEAVELAAARWPQVQFLCGDSPASVGDSIRDARLVLFLDVLEHVPDDFWMLSQWLAATTAGAHFLITVPADPALWSPHDEAYGHYRRYDRRRLVRLWDDLPVATLLVSYFNSRLLPMVKLVRLLGRVRGQASGRAGTDLRLPISPVNRLLQRVFAGEAHRLSDALAGRRRGYAAGVSLVALLRRETGDIPVRRRPADVAPDCHVPVCSVSSAAC